ncbi:MAG: hypothetical protein VKK98_03075 [Cyanobacteriota bacterium]|nr:hypothetical protein [Cyanobacteriota bacterium]
MAALTCRSDTLVGSLCREADRIRQRSRQLSAALQCCHSVELSERLRREGHGLEQRRAELLAMARLWCHDSHKDRLALEFLIELCRRSPGVC